MVIATPVGVLSSWSPRPRAIGNLWARRTSATAGGGFGYERPEKWEVPPPTATGVDHQVALASPSSSERRATPRTSMRVSADPSSSSATSAGEWPCTLDSAWSKVSTVETENLAPEPESPSFLAHFWAALRIMPPLRLRSFSSNLIVTRCPPMLPRFTFRASTSTLLVPGRYSATTLATFRRLSTLPPMLTSAPRYLSPETPEEFASMTANNWTGAFIYPEPRVGCAKKKY